MTLSIRKTIALVAAVAGLTVAAAPALAEGGAHHMKEPGFSFEGPFGTFDQAQLQRGYKVYREVCAACHSMNLLHFRDLGIPGGPFYDEHAENPAANRFVKAIAAEAQVAAIDTETGESMMRPGIAADKFPSPYPNHTAAAAANGGAAPPDLSVMAKARHGGANYIYSLLTGYDTPPAGLKMTSTQHYNAYMAGDLTPFMPQGAHVPPGGFIAMPNPLASDGLVTYDDGTVASKDQMAKDVSAFIAWASEPHAVERKQAGFGVLAFLLLFTGITYVSYRRIWKGIAH
ncbi:cytochrome c1 [Brevundimonas sp.]|uniref:cytochrome c1 n=1 Tax=Brevundimonas sp. TaxID=1871086 RepID=UPI001A24C371|nr:cytochrome c1 [Brevundimonas sp.]MBJ7485289.1 cytochrome c1 [Brevundimonas sp.]